MVTRTQGKAPETTQKRKRGRPTDYRPSMCETVIQLGTEGKSKAQIARSLETSRVTLDAWAKRHPDFLYALNRSRELALAWWEDKGQEGIDKGQGSFNATAFIFQMKNRFRDDYRDRHDHEHGVTDALSSLLEKIDAGPRGLPNA
jgi:hypothetical protein